MIVINFGEFLREKRNEKNMSMRELERKTGLSQSYISQVESGNRTTPKPETLKRIADGLDISYESLMLAAGYVHTNSLAVGEFIKLIRQERKMSVEELAEKSRISHVYISQIEKGTREAPQLDTLKNLSIGLDVPYETLMVAAGYSDNNVQERFNNLKEKAGNEYTTEEKYFLDLHQLFIENNNQMRTRNSIIDLIVHYKGRELTDKETKEIGHLIEQKLKD